MDIRLAAFIDWFLSIPDVDESLIDEMTDDGLHFKDSTAELIWFAFKAGYCRSLDK